MMHIIQRIEAGEDVNANTELLKKVALQMQNKCLCALGEFATMAVVSGIENFPEDFKETRNGGGHE
jgi:NADH-quinone oxidoreductase subunit F